LRFCQVTGRLREMEQLGWIASAAIVIVPLLVAVVCHEVAHGAVALACGDDTAKRAGRLTLHPLRHLDPFGTVVLPGLLMVLPLLFGGPSFVFGYAKPVPIDPSRFRAPRRDEILVALAGPGANLLLALASAFALAALTERAGASPAERWLAAMLTVSLRVNCLLAVFNLLPLPPLDGGRVLAALLPWRGASRLVRSLEGLGMVVVLLVVFNTPLLPLLVRPLMTWLLWMAK